jgi:DNA-directed RNA polymerase subunit RPC12/RpoP
MKTTYKCEECKTIISIETEVHELPESIICPCDQVMPSIGE